MYTVLSGPQVIVAAMSESGNMHLNNSDIPSFPLYEWCLTIVLRVHNTSAFMVGVGPKDVRRSTLVAVTVVTGGAVALAVDWLTLSASSDTLTASWLALAG